MKDCLRETLFKSFSSWIQKEGIHKTIIYYSWEKNIFACIDPLCENNNMARNWLSKKHVLLDEVSSREWLLQKTRLMVNAAKNENEILLLRKRWTLRQGKLWQKQARTFQVILKWKQHNFFWDKQKSKAGQTSFLIFFCRKRNIYCIFSSAQENSIKTGGKKNIRLLASLWSVVMYYKTPALRQVNTSVNLIQNQNEAF